MQNSGHFDGGTQSSALDVFIKMDGRKSLYTREVLDWHREEDFGDLRGNELNDSVENIAALNAITLRPWREAKTQVTETFFFFLKNCGFVARTFRNTSAPISADGTILLHNSKLWISSMASSSESWHT